jgi:D-glutamate cyclase
VGMGKIYHTIVNSSINHAQEIACSVPANSLIIASVSNWGGYGLVAATAALHHHHLDNNNNNSCASWLTTLLPTDEEETDKCRRIVAAGARDGMTAKQEMMVDGMPFSETLRVLGELRQVASDKP